MRPLKGEQMRVGRTRSGPWTRGDRHQVVAPDLGLGDTPVAASLWLAAVGRPVAEGEPVLELVAGDVTFDLPAPVSGVLAERRVEEDDLVQVGQVLGVIIAAE
jgi:pyruvate/2-oxoglutarate dehydrogenase complex dihydrolipoamide acyltransferase (E2) component